MLDLRTYQPEDWDAIANRCDRSRLDELRASVGIEVRGLRSSRVLFDDLTRNFVVVSWDQRGTGKSYAALDPTSTLTLEQAIADTIELSQYLRSRFHQQKIYLLGESWGSTLGVLAVQRRPDLYYAWIGSGQMVSQRETDRRLYYDLLALAAKENDTALATKMRAYGEPPYADSPYANALAFILVNLWVYLLWSFVSRPRPGGQVVLKALGGSQSKS